MSVRSKRRRSSSRAEVLEAAVDRFHLLRRKLRGPADVFVLVHNQKPYAVKDDGVVACNDTLRFLKVYTADGRYVGMATVSWLLPSGGAAHATRNGRLPGTVDR